MTIMKNKDYITKSFLNALGTFIYISLIASLIFFGPFNSKTPTFLMPVFVLTLFIISASVTGFLVLGKPAQLYLAGAKREAVILFFSTLAWLALFLLLVVLALSFR